MVYYTKVVLLLHAPVLFDQVVIDIQELKCATLCELILTHADCCLEDLEQVHHVVVARLLNRPDGRGAIMLDEDY